jgi:hypothetical protein
MSLPLHDLGNVKVDEVTHSMLRARAMSKKIDLTAFVRELLDSWAAEELHVFSIASSLHESKGFGAINGDSK